MRTGERLCLPVKAHKVLVACGLVPRGLGGDIWLEPESELQAVREQGGRPRILVTIEQNVQVVTALEPARVPLDGTRRVPERSQLRKAAVGRAAVTRY